MKVPKRSFQSRNTAVLLLPFLWIHGMQYQDPLYPQNFVCHDDKSVGYYALIIEDLILIPKEQNIALDLTRCVTFPGGEQIPTQFQGLVCTDAPMPGSTTYKTAWVIGKANLTNPYAVRLLPP